MICLVIQNKSRTFALALEKQPNNTVDVVQLVRASDCGSECRGFEPHPPPLKRQSLTPCLFFFICQTLRAPLTRLETHRKTKYKNSAASHKLAALYNNSPWSWRESNPRPNRETIRFLHAYSGLRFSCCNKTRTTNRSLIP